MATTNGSTKYDWLVTCPAGKTGDVTINEDCKVVKTMAFQGCSKITNVDFANIGEIEKWGCRGLGTDNGDDNFTLTIKSNNSTLAIGDKAFYNCTTLKEVTIGNNVTSIGEQAFTGDAKLQTITFEAKSTLTSIGNQAFSTVAATEIAIPASVTTMGDAVFQNSKMQTVTFDDGSQLASLGSTFKDASELTTVTFGGNCTTLTAIGPNCFQNAKALTNVNKIPASVTSIGESAFSGCTNLNVTDFEEGSGLTEIGNWAFQETGLTKFDVPSNCTTIGQEAFVNCPNLKTVTIPAATNSIGLRFVAQCDNLENISVARSNETYSSSDGILLSKDKTHLIQFPGGKARESFTLLPPSITNIDQYAFYYCSKLKNVVIPKKVQTIGNYAFYMCEALNSITFLSDAKPANVETDAAADDAAGGNNSDHRFGTATVLPKAFLKENVTINVRKDAPAESFKATGSYWSDPKSWTESFEEANSISGRTDVTNKYEYLAMSETTYGVLHSASTCYTAVVPAQVNGKNVGMIADYAFEDINSNVKEMVFLGPIEYVGSNAFNNGHANNTYVAVPTSNIENIFVLP